MKEGRKLLSNAVYLYFDWLSMTILGFIYWFIIAKMLSPSQYGIISTSINLATLFSSIAILGMYGPLSKLIPEYLETRNIIKVKSLVRFSLKIVFPTVMAIATVLILLSSILSPLINLPVGALILVAILLIFMTLDILSKNVLYGFQDMKKIFKTNLIGQSIKVVLSSVLLFLTLSYFGPLIAVIVGFLLAFLLRFKLSLYFGKFKVDKSFIFNKYAIPSLITSFAVLIYCNSQFIIINTMKSPELTGLFGIAYTLVALLFMIPIIISTALLPIISQLSIGNNIKKQSYLIHLVLRYTILVILPIAIILAFFSKPLILLISQPEYLSASQILPYLAIFAMFFGVAQIFLYSLYAIKKPYIQRNIWIIVAILFLIISIPLTYYFSIFGMSIAYVITSLVMAILGFIYIKKFLKFFFPLISILKMLISISIFFLILKLFDIFNFNIFINILFVLVAMLIYLLTLIPLKFYISEDVRILQILSQKSPILRKQLLLLSQFLSKYI